MEEPFLPYDFIYAFEAFAKDEAGIVLPFVLRIARPRYGPARGHYCEIHCPNLRKKAFRIFGVDDAHACELSMWFVRRRLVDLGITLIDAGGSEVPLPEIDYAPGPE